ncbi:bL21 family ribosomal protein [Candidatus Daviesbacteria bacterium]|nr:bL21 family ribosomal protein [Candidatus Daviesbacteria bacterium]
MLNYAVVEISGKQYLVKENQVLRVNFLGNVEKFICDKVLAKSIDGELKLGSPYLKDSIEFEVLGTNKEKIRVATYKAKSNTRRVKGAKVLSSKIGIKIEKKAKNKENSN